MVYSIICPVWCVWGVFTCDHPEIAILTLFPEKANFGHFGHFWVFGHFWHFGENGHFWVFGYFGQICHFGHFGEMVKKWVFRKMAILGEIAVVGKNGYFCENVVFSDFGRSLENRKLGKM